MRCPERGICREAATCCCVSVTSNLLVHCLPCSIYDLASWNDKSKNRNPSTPSTMPATWATARCLRKYAARTDSLENRCTTREYQPNELKKMTATTATHSPGSGLGGKEAEKTLPKNYAAFGLVKFVRSPRRKAATGKKELPTILGFEVPDRQSRIARYSRYNPPTI